jgi:hypothetical protein
MEKLADALKQVLDELADKRAREGACSVQERFAEILTEREREHAQAAFLRKGILGVTVDSSSWLYYFTTRKAKLIEALLPHISGLREIKFSVGTLKK